MAKQYPIEATLYAELPKYKVTSLRGSGMWKVDGDDYEELDLSTRSISTYPLLPGGEKDGDPIADRLYVQRHENRALLAVADGCNWGKRPQMAAKNAVAALAAYFNERQADIRDLHDAGHFLLRSFSEAHYSIVQGKEDIWEAGTTTLLGILILELEPGEGIPKWGLLCGSVGDCKAFHVNMKTREILDITSGNRDNVKDSRDPGGRLGPYEGHGWPDLRNLRLYFSPAVEDDIIVVVSDGVHDNLDPQTLGKFPADLNLPQKTWEELTTDGLHRAKANYMKTLLGELIFNNGGPVTPTSITESLMKHCWAVTAKSREFMEKNPNKKQPTDYVGFPGKMDHTTCISFVIGKPPVHSNSNNNNNNNSNPTTWPSSSSSSSPPNSHPSS
jgi:serine/threonine protein phosphatase PrpC